MARLQIQVRPHLWTSICPVLSIGPYTQSALNKYLLNFGEGMNLVKISFGDISLTTHTAFSPRSSWYSPGLAAGGARAAAPIREGMARSPKGAGCRPGLTPGGPCPPHADNSVPKVRSQGASGGEGRGSGFRALEPTELAPQRTFPSQRECLKKGRRKPPTAVSLKQLLSPQSIWGRGYKADNLYSQLGWQRRDTPRSVQKQRYWVREMAQDRASALVLPQQGVWVPRGQAGPWS